MSRTKSSKILRTKSVHVRYTNDEYEKVRAKCPDRYLSNWIRKLSLKADGDKPASFYRPPKTDPALLREAMRIRANLNLIARMAVRNKDWSNTNQILLILAIRSFEEAWRNLNDF